MARIAGQLSPDGRSGGFPLRALSPVVVPRSVQVRACWHQRLNCSPSNNSKGLFFQIHSGLSDLGLLSASYGVISQGIVETLALESVALEMQQESKEIHDGHCSRIYVHTNSRPNSPTGRR